MYMENKMLHKGSTKLTTERAGRDKDLSEQQLNKKENKKEISSDW